MSSPYDRLLSYQWKLKTEELVAAHPLETSEIVQVVLEAWEGILMTQIAGKLQIGVDIFPSPQILGNYLHELIPIILSNRNPKLWRKEFDKSDKDLVYMPNIDYSVEIKTSSSTNGIFGNRSYGQENSENNSGKSKDGYYVTVNFEKFNSSNPHFKPNITKIRFGWIDHSDWRAQASPTGQQASLSPEARDNKLLLLYSK